MRRMDLLSRPAPVPTDAAVFPAAAFRDMNGVGKLPPVHAGTPSAIILNRRFLHLFS